MIDWMNCNQGFIMGILTLFYLGATILIWGSNRKSAKAATLQIEEMKRIQQQNVSIQLFNKKYETYNALCDYYSVVKDVFSNSTVQKETGDLLNPIEVFQIRVFREVNFWGIPLLSVEIQKLEAMIDKSSQSEQTEKQLKTLNDIKEIIKEHREKISSIKSVHKKVYSIGNVIIEIEYYFPSIDFEKIRNFSDAFVSMAENQTVENLKALETAYRELEKANVLQQMKEQLKAM